MFLEMRGLWVSRESLLRASHSRQAGQQATHYQERPASHEGSVAYGGLVFLAGPCGWGGRGSFEDVFHGLALPFRVSLQLQDFHHGGSGIHD